jgi:hypothetical protein
MSVMAGLPKTKPSTRPYPEFEPKFYIRLDTKPIIKRFRHGRPDRGRSAAASAFCL